MVSGYEGLRIHQHFAPGQLVHLSMKEECLVHLILTHLCKDVLVDRANFNKVYYFLPQSLTLLSGLLRGVCLPSHVCVSCSETLGSGAPSPSHGSWRALIFPIAVAAPSVQHAIQFLYGILYFVKYISTTLKLTLPCGGC